MVSKNVVSPIEITLWERLFLILIFYVITMPKQTNMLFWHRYNIEHEHLKKS